MIFSPNIIGLIKSRKMRRARQIANMGKKRGAYRSLVGTTKNKTSLKDLGVGRNIVLKWILKKWDGVAWTGLI
jgi:hypothetical protein